MYCDLLEVRLGFNLVEKEVPRCIQACLATNTPLILAEQKTLDSSFCMAQKCKTSLAHTAVA